MQPSRAHKSSTGTCLCLYGVPELVPAPAPVLVFCLCAHVCAESPLLVCIDMAVYLSMAGLSRLAGAACQSQVGTRMGSANAMQTSYK